MADLSRLRERLRDRAERRHAIAVGSMIEAVQDAAPTDSGILAASVGQVAGQSDEGRVSATIAAPLDYASFQDKGTGIHGPTGQRITSASGGPLVFEVGGATVFAMSVAGVEPTLFWSDNVTADAWSAALEDAGAYL